MWAQDSRPRLKMQASEMSERHLTATQRQRTQLHEGPPQMKGYPAGPWSQKQGGGPRAKPSEDGMGPWPLLLRDLGGCPGVWAEASCQ